jgi:hypothetical protein
MNKVQREVSCLAVLVLLASFPACASASSKKGFFSSWFSPKVADEVKVGDKVTGIEKLNATVSQKVADKLEIKAGDKSTREILSNTAGGNVITRATSDPKVLIAVSSALFTFMGGLAGGLFLIIRQKDKQISLLLTGQQAFIKQQDESQCKLFGIVEKIVIMLIEDKIKEGENV